MADLTDGSFDGSEVPPLDMLTPEHKLKEFLFAAMMELFEHKDSRPGLSGTMAVNGNVFAYDFTLQSIYVPHRENLDTEH